MATATRETEFKYDAPTGAPPADLPELLGLPHVAAISPPRTLHLDATYYDTAALDLTRAAVTLRHRPDGDDAGWHLKFPEGAPGARTELHLPNTSGRNPPAEFVALLTARTRTHPLAPVATISTRRRVRTLTDASGAPLAEIAHDTVTSAVVGSDEQPRHWTEVEFELAENVQPRRAARLLAAADRALRRNGLTRSPRRMKLQAALASPTTTPPEPPNLRKTSPAADVVLTYLRAQYEELVQTDLRVRRSEPDSVHRMRIAARRSRAALQEFGPLFLQDQSAHLIAELRWLGQELSDARDQEVLRDLFLQLLDEIPPESVRGPISARITAHFATTQAEAHDRMRDALSSARYLNLLDEFEVFITTPPRTDDAALPAKDVLPKLVRHARRRFEHRMRNAHRAAPHARDHELHQARKAAKRARYAAEIAAPALGKPPKKSMSPKWFKQMQSTLGAHQDAVIADEVLQTIADRAHANGEHTYTYGVLHERLTAQLAQSAQRAARRAH